MTQFTFSSPLSIGSRAVEEKLNIQTNMDSISSGMVGRHILKETGQEQGCEPRIKGF